jgi:hypothetical protein
VLSGRDLCDGPITHPEDSTECDMSECDHGTSKTRRPSPTMGLLSHAQRKTAQTLGSEDKVMGNGMF